MSPAVRHFARHYVEMVAAMVLGMALLWLPFGWALNAAGMTMSELHDDAPALMLLSMAVLMTVPMVAWMHHRGHSWERGGEMAAAMFVLALALLVLFWLGVISAHVVLPLELALMIPSMVLVMLCRVDEYSGPRPETASSAPPGVRAAQLGR